MPDSRGRPVLMLLVVIQTSDAAAQLADSGLLTSTALQSSISSTANILDCVPCQSWPCHGNSCKQ